MKILLTGMLFLMFFNNIAYAKLIEKTWNFEDVPMQKLPTGWKEEATNPKDAIAKWMIIKDKTAPSGQKVLSLKIPQPYNQSTFNLCWTDTVSFLDGEIEVHFKAISGEEDQGGGVIWRVQDADNYYVARYNPLESNFRIYNVRKGVRRIMASTQIILPAKEWHTLKIVQFNNQYAGYINDKEVLTGTDSHIMQPGGVGMWTKADANTTFDDFIIRFKDNKPTK